jgi:hypothetical protein
MLLSSRDGNHLSLEQITQYFEQRGGGESHSGAMVDVAIRNFEKSLRHTLYPCETALMMAVRQLLFSGE